MIFGIDRIFKSSQKNHEEKIADCFRKFLIEKDAKALTSHRGLVPGYFAAFGIFVQNAARNGDHSVVVEHMAEMLEEGKLSEQAIIGVDMTLLSVSCGERLTFDYAGWTEYDNRMEKSYTCRSQELKDSYFNFGHELMSSLVAMKSTKNGKINEGVLRIAIMSAVLFVNTARKLGLDKSQNWGSALGGRAESDAKKIKQVFYGVNDLLGKAILDKTEGKANPCAAQNS